MKNCIHCGAVLEDSDVFCAKCGCVQTPEGGPQYAKLTGGHAAPYPQPGPAEDTANATVYLVWSIILVLFTRSFGLIGIVFSALAKTAKSPAAARDHLRAAKIVCIAGTCVGAVILLIAIAYVLFWVAFASSHLVFSTHLG